MKRAEFDRLLTEVLATLPVEFQGYADAVCIIVEDEPSDEQIRGVGLDPEYDTLFGLYEGTPLPEREHNYAMALTDRVTIFRGPLIDVFTDRGVLEHEIRKTLIHELAHHFGFDDEEIDDLGY